MSRQDYAADRVLSFALKSGAYTAFALIVAGLLLRWVTPWGMKVATAGLLVLLATPVAAYCGGLHSVFPRARFEVCSGVAGRAEHCGAGVFSGDTGLKFVNKTLNTAKDAKAAKEPEQKRQCFLSSRIIGDWMKKYLLLLILLFVASDAAIAQSLPPVSTFSIVAIDPQTGEMGVAVASRYFSVGSVVPWAMADVGAVATQANVNVGYGQQAIDLLRQGLTAPEVLKKILADDKFEGKDGRQVAIVDAKGNVAAYTGPNAPKWAGDRQGKTWSAQGNILVGPQVPESMGKAFEATQGELAEKLFAALKAGDSAGGDARGRQSASILVVKKLGGRNINNDREVYINVDDNPDPFTELRRLLDLNLAYIYGDQTFKALDAGNNEKARAAAQKALRYAPNSFGSHMRLAFINYLVGDKAASLDEFAKAKALDPAHFDKQWKEEVDFDRFKPMAGDKEFLGKLFPNGVPQ